MIPRSSYYKWLKHEESVIEIENKMLMAEIIKLYDEVDSIYDYRRMTMNLNQRLDKNFDLNRVYRLMRLSGNSQV